MPHIDDAVMKPELEVSSVENEIGVAFNLPFAMHHTGSTDIRYPRMSEVKISELVRMRQTDGQVRALIRLLTLPIRAAVRDMIIESDEGGEAEMKFIEDVFMLPTSAGGMMHTFEFFIAQALQALVEGFKAFELIYKVPGPDSPLHNKITYHKLACRDSETVTFLLDKNNAEMTGLYQKATFAGKEIDVTIPKDKLFIYTANEEENPFYGVSYFLPAYYHWDKKIKMYYLTHLAAQHRAIPGRAAITKPHLSKEAKQQLANALSQYGVGGAFQLPADWVDSVEEWGKSMSSFNFMEIINHHNAQMSKSVLAQFLDSQDSNTTLITTTSDDQDEMFVLELSSIISELTSEINETLIPRLIDWNFGSSRYPKVVFRPLTEEQKDAVRSMFSAIVTAQTIHVSPEFLFQLEQEVAQMLGLDVDYESLENEMQEEADLNKEKMEVEIKKAEAEVKKLLEPPPPPAPMGQRPSGAPPGQRPPGPPRR